MRRIIRPYIYILSISSRLRLIVNKPAHTISIFCLHIYMTFAYFVRWKRCRRHWFFKKKSDSCLFPSVLLSVGTEAALRARTKALQCGISALDIMTLRGCSGSYGRGGGVRIVSGFAVVWNVIWNLTRYEEAIPFESSTEPHIFLYCSLVIIKPLRVTHVIVW